MENLTLAIPSDLKKRMKRHSEIRWSEVVRKSITQKIEMLETMEKIANKSKLTQKEVDEISKKIKSETFKEISSL